MIVLVEAIFTDFTKLSGIERYAINLVKALKNNGINVLLMVSKDVLDLNLKKCGFEDVDIIRFTDTEENWKELNNKYSFDILHCTFVPPPLNTIEVPILYTLHDPGRYLYSNAIDIQSIEIHMKRFEDLLNNDKFHVLTVSKSSYEDILLLFPQIKEKLYYVYNFSCKQRKTILECNYNLPENYYLSVGKFYPLKNTLTLVKAWKKYVESTENLNDYLIIVGKSGWYKDFDDYVKNNKVKNLVIYDYVPDDFLKSLYSNTKALIFPSIYEGFGYPIIECVQYNVKRIFCSDIKVFREIAPKGTVFFNPYSIDDVFLKCFCCDAQIIDVNDEYTKKFSLYNNFNKLKKIYVNLTNGE